jgi:hypothetical protein
LNLRSSSTRCASGWRSRRAEFCRDRARAVQSASWDRPRRRSRQAGQSSRHGQRAAGRRWVRRPGGRSGRARLSAGGVASPTPAGSADRGRRSVSSGRCRRRRGDHTPGAVGRVVAAWHVPQRTVFLVSDRELDSGELARAVGDEAWCRESGQSAACLPTRRVRRKIRRRPIGRRPDYRECARSSRVHDPVARRPLDISRAYEPLPGVGRRRQASHASLMSHQRS